MRKLNVVLIQGNKKNDAILKIKDDSLTIATNDGNLIKIPYSNIKNSSYHEDDEQLHIIQYGGSTTYLGMKKDQQLINQLREISQQKNEEIIQTEYVKTEQKEINSVKKMPSESIDQESQTTTLNNAQVSNDDSATSIRVNIFDLIPVIIGIGFFIWGVYWLSGGAETNSRRDSAERAAVSKLAGDYLSPSEISCKYNSTSGDIIIVKCTTTSDILIDSFDSNTIWFGYLPSASGSNYRYSVGINENEVILELN